MPNHQPLFFLEANTVRGTSGSCTKIPFGKKRNVFSTKELEKCWKIIFVSTVNFKLSFPA